MIEDSVHRSSPRAFRKTSARPPSKRVISRGPGLGMLLVIVMVFPIAYLFAGDKPRSLALKELTPERHSFRLPPDYSGEKLWDEFLLVRRANSGDAPAQHELGLRYLMGEGFPADTAKAVFWIRKAADQHLLSAQYNLGILLNNGWGIDWNPFEAYRHFQYSAQHGFVESQYVYGLLLTDNLLVPRNYVEAYRWIKSAADSGYSPAKETLHDFEQRGILARVRSLMADTSSTHASSQSRAKGAGPPTLQPLDFDLVSDTTVEPDDAMLVREAIAPQRAHEGEDGADSLVKGTVLDSATIESVRESAEAGSPEALTVEGRMYELGTGVQPNLIQASVYYLRAIRFDSPWSPILLWRMIHREGYYSMLKRQVDNDDRDAAYVWSGLVAFGFDRQLTEPQALNLLERAADAQNPDALTELALCFSSGYWVRKDHNRSIALLREAEQLGSREAMIRLTLLELQQTAGETGKAGIVDSLRNYERNGSVLAQAMLGYCYQNGKGVRADTPVAVRWYRAAARRGSRIAYDALRQLYDNLRPADPEFRIPDSTD